MEVAAASTSLPFASARTSAVTLHGDKPVCMDTNQAKIIELLQYVHLTAINEIERLNLRIAELESRDRQLAQPPARKPNRRASSAQPADRSESIRDRAVERVRLKISVAGRSRSSL